MHWKGSWGESGLGGGERQSRLTTHRAMESRTVRDELVRHALDEGLDALALGVKVDDLAEAGRLERRGLNRELVRRSSVRTREMCRQGAHVGQNFE